VISQTRGSRAEPATTNERTVWSPSGVVDRRVDARGLVTAFRYDQRLALVEVIAGYGSDEPLHRRVRYDRVGLPIKIIDARGCEIRVERDPWGREARFSHPDGETVEVERDAAGRVVRARQFGPHHETGQVVRWSEQSYLYDELGRLIVSTAHRFVPGSASSDPNPRVLG
jgi:YD repeat-containing protein